MRNCVAAGVFRVAQLALLPIAAVGYVFWVARLITFSRTSGASATLLASFYTRWMQHKLGTRCDDACARLMKVLPNVPQLALHLVTAPTLVAHAMTGYVPRLYRYPYEGDPAMKHQSVARTTFYDAALARHLAGVDQLVILGAGLDTRAYGLPAQARVHCFELDTPKSQAFKREMLQRAGVDTARVTYVPADLQEEDWFAKLVDAGFTPDKPTFFLWEAVTMYLARRAVEGTLRKIAGTAPGSVVAFDYVSAELLAARTLFMRYTRTVLKATREPWRFGLDNEPPARQRVAAFLASCGLSLDEHRTFGQETSHKRAKAGFATAVVRSP